jgi:hypothetical protein
MPPSRLGYLGAYIVYWGYLMITG